VLVQEVLWRTMRDRRAVARYAGLTGAPDESSAKRREKGLARSGNARVRRGMIQLAWRFLMAARRVLAACDVAAKRHRAAALDCTHHLQLVEAHMAAVGLTPGPQFRDTPFASDNCDSEKEKTWPALIGEDVP
jgi:transposase